MTNSSNNTPFSDISCSLFPAHKNYCDILITVKRCIGTISLIGCLFVILVIWIFRKYVAFTQRLILYLSIAACFDSITYLMGDLYSDGPWCDFQAFMLTLFDWSVLLWVCCITFNLYMNAIVLKQTDKYEWLYHLISWGFPLLMACLPFISDHYGPAGTWCWIKGDNGGIAWRFGIWYGPLFAIIILLFIIYIYITVMIRRKVRTWEGLYDPDTERKKQLLKEDVKPLKGYPFVYLGVSIFPLINRIQNGINPDNPIFALYVLMAISAPLQGALNAVVFGLDKDTTSRLTWSQIKLALLSRGKGRSIIREYPTDMAAAEEGAPGIKET